MATGEDFYAPSFSQQHGNEAEHEDVYRPTMDEEEGSGDSEDDQFGTNPVGSTGVTDELRSIGLSTETPPSGPSDSGSRGKRKVVDRPIERKKHKVPASRQIADAASVMSATSKEKLVIFNELATAQKEKLAADASASDKFSVENVMSDLMEIEEVQADEDFRNRCIKLLMTDIGRQTFVSLKKNKHYLVGWLRFMVNNP